MTLNKASTLVAAKSYEGTLAKEPNQKKKASIDALAYIRIC